MKKLQKTYIVGGIICTLKQEKKINYLFAAALSIGFTCLVYFGFTKGFHMLLPRERSGPCWASSSVLMLEV